MLSTGYFEVRAVRLIAAAIALVGAMFAGLLVAPGVAHAYEVHVSITGSGMVNEDPKLDQADLVTGCYSPQSTPTGTVGKDCYPGEPDGPYGYAWRVRWTATPHEGWEFVRWQSDGTSTTPVICDGANGSSTYTGQSCQFQTYENLQTQAVFRDVTAPTVGITGGPAAGGTSGRDVDFDFGVTNHPEGQPVDYRCKLTGPTGVVQDWHRCVSQYENSTYSSLSDGSHTFEVEAKDPSGNSSVASRTWNVDAIAPETTLTSDGPAEGSTITSRSAFFQWTGSTDTLKYRCQVDFGSVIDPCSSPRSISSLADGTHNFRVWAEDTHGNVESSPASRTWTVDGTAPTLNITSGPDGGTYAAGSTQTWNFSASDATSGIQSVQCSVVATGTAPSFGPCSGGNTSHSVTNKPQGSYTFTVKALDNVGLETTQSRNFSIDATLPETTLDASGPSGTTKATSAAFTFSSEAGATFECKLDGAAFTACTSPKGYTALANGSHTFQVRAIDQAGNTGPAASRTWRVDTIKPTISAMFPRHASIIRDTTPTIKAVVRDNLTNLQKANVKLYVAGKLISPTKYSYSASTDVLLYNSPRLSKGKKTVKVVATDAARNVGTKSWYFTIR